MATSTGTSFVLTLRLFEGGSKSDDPKGLVTLSVNFDSTEERPRDSCQAYRSLPEGLVPQLGPACIGHTLGRNDTDSVQGIVSTSNSAAALAALYKAFRGMRLPRRRS